jgi:hypothetical protein
MMSFNVRAKSAVLAFAMVVSSSISCVEFSNPFAGIISSIAANQKKVAISTIACFLAALKVRLDTKPRCHYTFENWQEDITDLLNSYNIFDTASRTTIMKFLDKYFVGSKFKREETTTRTKNDDGSVLTVMSRKVVQKPSGAMGLVDAYVFTQMKGLTELIPAAVGLYLLVNDPYGFFGRETAKQIKEPSKEQPKHNQE